MVRVPLMSISQGLRKRLDVSGVSTNVLFYS